MYLFHCLLILIPGIIAANKEIRKSKKSTLYNWIVNVSKYTIEIFWIINAFLYFRGWAEFDWQRLSVQFLIKEIPLSLLIAFILPYLHFFWHKRILGDEI